MVLGGLLKLLLAGVIAWAWLNGHLASIAGQVTAMIGGAGASSTSTSATSSSTGSEA